MDNGGRVKRIGNRGRRIHEGESSTYVPDKGLREGCPSSPVLFNKYHDVVMEDFRARRAEAAERANRTPGIN